MNRRSFLKISAGAAAAIWEAVEADLDLAICITEGIPVKDMLEVRNRMRAKIAAGGKDNGAPGPRPQYHPGYYGAFVLDPDGHNLEAVIHTPE